MKEIVNIENWERKVQYYFFKEFDEPFFGVTVNVDCTKAFQSAKEKKVSFFLYYLYCSLKAANSIKEFRYRIDGDNVLCYETVNASPTITRENGTFGFGNINYYDDFEKFIKEASEEIESVKNASDLKPTLNNENIIHYSTLPWLSFTAINLTIFRQKLDSIPKITFGKYFEQDGKKLMPVSVHVNHALMDGFHVGKYVELFQNLLDG